MNPTTPPTEPCVACAANNARMAIDIEHTCKEYARQQTDVLVEARELHDADCFFRTHNSRCDCAAGPIITKVVQLVEAKADEWERKTYGPYTGDMQDSFAAKVAAARELAKQIKEIE